MNRKAIRWGFLIAFAAFMGLMKYSGLLHSNTNIFIVVWLVASYITIFGVVFFKDKKTAEK
ncbi:MAG: hypothetical protein Q4E17_00980 [Synergistes sp.]|nr:hypothetical protein [Synergistes sp.]